MNIRIFFKQLTLLTFAVALLLFFLHTTDNFKEHYSISVVSIVFFYILSILIYLIGVSALKSSNKNAFIQVIIGFVFSKMLLSVILLVAYHQMVHPPSNHFLLPFFIVYLFYTFFETYMMIQLGKQPPVDTNSTDTLRDK